MANLAKTTVFTSSGYQKETPIDKTTRIVRNKTDDKADVHQQKTARLHKARFEIEVDTLEL